MNVKQWAIELLADPTLVILDTETTGLSNDSEAVQIGILSPQGEVLLDTLVKPKYPIPADATWIHGITNDMVADAPTILGLEDELKRLIYNKTVAVYNAPYDYRILWQSFEVYSPVWLDDSDSGCWLEFVEFTDVMDPYARHWGEWNDYHQSYKWQKLSNACRQQGIIIEDAHNAIGDCRMTLALLRKLAE